MIAMDMTTRYAMRYVMQAVVMTHRKIGLTALYDLLTLGSLYIKLPPTGREKGAMVDNFPAVWLSQDGLCCRRCGRTGLSSMWWPKGEHYCCAL